MQRIPTKNIPRNNNGFKNTADTSPMLLLARRIREEQGIEQVKAFLTAMIPFSAPNELKYISEGFGISYDSVVNSRMRSQGNSTGLISAGSGNGINGNGEDRYAEGSQNRARIAQSAPQMQMLQTLMQFQGLMGNGKPDMMQLFKMMGGGR